MKKVFGTIAIFLLATAFCVFGQGIAYFLNEYVFPVAPVYYVTALTGLGISLYAGAALAFLRLLKSGQFPLRHREIYFLVLFTVAPLASIWAIFVTAMWWG